MKNLTRYFLMGLVLLAVISPTLLAAPALPMSKLSDINDALDSGLPTVVMVTSASCTTCEDMKQYFPELAEQYKGKINFMIADADKTPNVKVAFGVRVAPTTLFFDKDGDMIKSFIAPITLANMKQWLVDLKFITK